MLIYYHQWNDAKKIFKEFTLDVTGTALYVTGTGKNRELQDVEVHLIVECKANGKMNKVIITPLFICSMTMQF